MRYELRLNYMIDAKRRGNIALTTRKYPPKVTTFSINQTNPQKIEFYDSRKTSDQRNSVDYTASDSTMPSLRALCNIFVLTQPFIVWHQPVHCQSIDPENTFDFMYSI